MGTHRTSVGAGDTQAKGWTLPESCLDLPDMDHLCGEDAREDLAWYPWGALWPMMNSACINKAVMRRRLARGDCAQAIRQVAAAAAARDGASRNPYATARGGVYRAPYPIGALTNGGK